MSNIGFRLLSEIGSITSCNLRYFHRVFTYNYVFKYEYVLFCLIHKLGFKSTIKLSDEVNNKIPVEYMNTYLVKNLYAALWNEYKKVKPAVSPMNLIRRIRELLSLTEWLRGLNSSYLSVAHVFL